MAKVLACPSCGHKHPLDLLVGLDSFVCQQCGKKLAVPLEASGLAPNIVPRPAKPTPVATSTLAPAPLTQPVENVSINSREITVVARSSMNVDAATTAPVVTAAASTAPVSAATTSNALPGTEPVAPSTIPERVGVPDASTSVRSNDGSGSESAGARTKIKNTSSNFLDKLSVPGLHIPFLGRLLSWAIALPVGFIIVVIIPRIFGYGFHASSFVDVITTSGIGRYKIVVALIFLWSLATVLCVSMCNGVIRKFLRARKVAV